MCDCYINQLPMGFKGGGFGFSMGCQEQSLGFLREAWAWEDGARLWVVSIGWGGVVIIFTDCRDV